MCVCVFVMLCASSVQVGMEVRSVGRVAASEYPTMRTGDAINWAISPAPIQFLFYSSIWLCGTQASLPGHWDYSWFCFSVCFSVLSSISSTLVLPKFISQRLMILEACNTIPAWLGCFLVLFFSLKNQKLAVFSLNKMLMYRRDDNYYNSSVNEVKFFLIFVCINISACMFAYHNWA